MAGKRSKLTDLFAVTGCSHPAEITEVDLHEWCTGYGSPLANNTIRQRISEARTFFAWCLRHGHIEADPAADLLARHSPLRRYQKVYGKRQGKHPGRWLTYTEAYEQLIPAVQDDTETGQRDELVIRLGLLGMRQGEIAALTWKGLLDLPRILWTGKGHTPRQATAGPTLVDLIGRYRSRYEKNVGALQPHWPVVCSAKSGPTRNRPLRWTVPIGPHSGIFRIVNAAGNRAGLGHVAPHDLRRSGAGILHRSTDHDGAHYFDLLDIQRVLGHADPATTMRSYLDPMDTEVLDRAAAVLD